MILTVVEPDGRATTTNKAAKEIRNYINQMAHADVKFKTLAVGKAIIIKKEERL